MFLLATLLIFSTSYTTYAFSKYRGVILPGVYVDHLDLSGMTSSQAENAIYRQLTAIYYRPLHIVFGTNSWDPKNTDIGLRYDVPRTVALAEGIGRKGGFLRDLIDRLPLHPDHHLAMGYALNPTELNAYLMAIANHYVQRPAVNAQLQTRPSGTIALIASRPGLRLDMPASLRAIESALGYLTRQTVALRADHISPVITNAAADSVKARVDRFLQHLPVIRMGKHRIVPQRTDLVKMISFGQKVTGPHSAVIQMNVSPSAVRAYIAGLAARVDRAPIDPRMDYSMGQVHVIQQARSGRTLDQAGAYDALLATITSLRPGAHLTFTVHVIQPPVDQTNPATLGITTLLAEGTTSFSGAPASRTDAIGIILKSLDGDLLPPQQQISFNTLVGTNWDPSVYEDVEVKKNGTLVPGAGGAMQQVATTFLRAMYGAGLTLVERHAHTYRLPWYEPPVGLDAVVAPDRNWDLVFTNNTGKYLLIKTRLEPVRQQAYIYVYGPKLGWNVSVDQTGKILKVIPHGPRLVRQVPTLPVGTIQQTQYAHDGAIVVVRRTITYRNGHTHTDEIRTRYSPWRAVFQVGTQSAAPNPTPTPPASKHRSSGSGGTPTPTPIPSG
ncbi:MAG TPA: peptidoglycan binding domain-containing protein [Chloroflexota bacterium]|nr:peptidoglycan binding domain-containing protein [Chloroflexota bacterium]